jgi:tRNA (guanine37-N1)-methyltransferase
VPEVLISGNHKEIEKWRKTSSIARTEKMRPDLLNRKN